MLHVINGLFYGGGQRVVLDLLDQLPETEQVDARLFCLGDCACSPLMARCEAIVPYDGRYNSLNVLWKTAKKLRAFVNSHAFDVVHTHGVDADLIGALALMGRPEKHVCHLHITPPANGKDSWKSRIRRKLFSRLTSYKGSWFIAVSEAVKEKMGSHYRLPFNRIVTVRNGIKLSEFSGDVTQVDHDESVPVVIGTAARLSPMKGLEFLLQAGALLEKRVPSFEIRIAGSGSSLQSLKQLAESLGIAHRVHFLGQVGDMPSFYRGIDIFVLPSVSTEGLPLVILEAMANAKPIVATNLAGTPEVIRNGIEGLLVAPGDADALGAALAQLASAPTARHDMGTAGRVRVSADFKLERVANEVVNVYKRVLNDG